jgi:hypothetical protein
MKFVMRSGRRFDPAHSEGDKCWVKRLRLWPLGQSNIATFEGMQLRRRGRVLLVEHYAVAGNLIGAKMAAPVLRAFAKHLYRRALSVQCIHFRLGRGGAGASSAQLAGPRAALLKQLGAIHIRQKPITAARVEVCAIWSKRHW